MKYKQLLTLILLLPAFVFNSGFSKTGNPFRNTLQNNKVVGASSYELLTDKKPSIVVEIQYMPGCKLRSATVDNLISFIQTYLNKPGGIQVIEKEIPAASQLTLSTAEIGRIENTHRTYYTTSKQVAIYFLITNGSSSDYETLGTAYRNTSIAIFSKTISRYAKGYSLTIKSKLETSTIEHEFGHLLGLVNLPSTIDVAHNDNAHHGHCTNKKCLMYYKAQGTEILNYLKGESVPGFDVACRNDLKAYGGK